MPDQPYHCGDESRDGDVGRHGAEPGLPTAAHDAEWQPVLHNEQIGWADAEHDDRMTIDTIAQADPMATAPGIPARSVCRCRRSHGDRDCPKSSGEWRACVARNRKA